MRMSYVWDRKIHDWAPIDKISRRKSSGIQVMSDLQPYRSLRTGEMIDGRRKHRDHLRAYGLTEVGNSFVPNQKSELSGAERAQDIRKAMRDI